MDYVSDYRDVGNLSHTIIVPEYYSGVLMTLVERSTSVFLKSTENCTFCPHGFAQSA